MADLHHLPGPVLPEGWGPSQMFADEWVRDVRLGTAHVGVLWVGMDEDGYFGRGFGVKVDECGTLVEAMAAVELAYCGCRVRR